MNLPTFRVATPYLGHDLGEYSYGYLASRNFSFPESEPQFLLNLVSAV